MTTMNYVSKQIRSISLTMSRDLGLSDGLIYKGIDSLFRDSIIEDADTEEEKRDLKRIVGMMSNNDVDAKIRENADAYRRRFSSIRPRLTIDYVPVESDDE